MGRTYKLFMFMFRVSAQVAEARSDAATAYSHTQVTHTRVTHAGGSTSGRRRGRGATCRRGRGNTQTEMHTQMDSQEDGDRVKGRDEGGRNGERERKKGN